MNEKKDSYQDNYVTVKIPKELGNKIDKLIEILELGYRNRTEFVIDAIRRRVEKINELTKKD